MSFKGAVQAKELMFSQFKDIGYAYLEDCLVKTIFEAIWIMGSVVLLSSLNRVGISY